MIHAFIALTASLIIFPAASATNAQQSGSIFPTTKSGSVVKNNVFASKGQVFLSGGAGPVAPCSEAGLTDGIYCFQITNVAGSVLLSADPVSNRCVLVSGGVITATFGNHEVGSGPCRSTPVTVTPLHDSLTMTVEHKMWMTRFADYDPHGSGVFGFDPARSKINTFQLMQLGKEPQDTLILGHKFYDFNESGVWEPNIPEEVGIPGWRIEIYRDGVLEEVQFTGEGGLYRFRRPMDGSTYVIREVAPGAGFIPNPGAIWLAKTPTEGTVVTNELVVNGPDFGNVSFTPAIGAGRTKGFWQNNNGKKILQGCDPAWRVELNEPYGTPLCLRRNDGTVFTVPIGPTFADAFALWKEYEVEDALGQAGFILSCQVAATALNHQCGGLQGTIYVDKHQDGILVSIDVMIDGVKTLLCDPHAYDTGPQTQFQDLRNSMLECSNEFESINSTGTLTNPQIAYRISDKAAGFQTPYSPAASR